MCYPQNIADGKVKITSNVGISAYVAKLLRAMEGETDSRVYATMQSFCKSLKQRNEPRDAVKRVNERVMTINHVLRSIKYAVPPNSSILDVGCADGNIVRAIGNFYGAGRVCGVDLMPTIQNDSIEYRQALETTYPFADESFDIITAFVTLHHIKLPGHISSIKRMLRHGGVLIIREHDCRDADTAAYLEVVHGVSETILEGKTPEKFYCDHYARYAKREDIDVMFRDLSPVFYSTYQVANNPQQLYHAAYVKK
jgi:SAM-dependent methyltransferase